MWASSGNGCRFLYESADVDFDENDPTYPIPREQLEQITNIRTRDVLDWCRTYRNRMIDGLDVAAPGSKKISAPVPAAFSGDLDEQIIHLTQLWNDCLADHRQPPPDDDDRLGALLGWAVAHVSREVDTGHRFLTTDEEGKLTTKVQGDGGVLETLKIGVCNRSPLGGALSRQVEQIQTWAGDDIPVLVRSTDFPDNPKTKIAQQIAAVVAVGGRRVVVEDSDWRAMRAMQTFLVEYEGQPGFADWLKTERPLAQLKSLREVLDLDALTVLPSAANANRQSRLEQEQTASSTNPAEACERLGDRGSNSHRHLASRAGRSGGRDDERTHAARGPLGRFGQRQNDRGFEPHRAAAARRHSRGARRSQGRFVRLRQGRVLEPKSPQRSRRRAQRKAPRTGQRLGLHAGQSAGAGPVDPAGAGRFERTLFLRPRAGRELLGLGPGQHDGLHPQAIGRGLDRHSVARHPTPLHANARKTADARAGSSKWSTAATRNWSMPSAD